MSGKNSSSNVLLLRQFQDGSQKAFQKLFDLYWEPMYLKAKSILSNEDIAKDIVQDIWVELWKSKKKEAIRDFEGYIFKAVSYGCFKYLRNNKFNAVQLSVIDALPSSNPGIEHQHNLEAAERVIAHSLKELSPRCRQIFRLSRMEDNSNEKIATQLGISKRSVENQVSLALKAIRRNLGILQKVPVLIFFFLN